MKTKLFAIGRWMALAVFVLVAGFCYSCSSDRQTALLIPAEEAALSDESEVWEEKSSEAMQALIGTEQMIFEPAQTCFVHVCGAVASPGVYEMEEGQRIFEAVELAGGFAGDAAPDYLNLAEPVRDGMKIFVPDKEQVQEENQSGLQGAAGGIAGETVSRVNINTASREELMTLRGIGKARAEDIIRYRQQNGGFERIEDIMEVSGIKDAAFQKIKDDITV